MSSSPPYYHHFRYNRPMFHPTRYIWRPVQIPQRHEQDQEELDMNNNTVVQMQSMGLQQAQVMMQRTTTYAANNVAAAADSVGEIIIPPQHLRRMMSFLEKDHHDSFLTPWGCNSSFPHQSDETPSFSFRGVKYHRFQPGSFFDKEYPEYFLKKCGR